LAIGKEEHRFLFFVGLRGQDGVVAGGMEAENDLGARGALHTEAEGTDDNAAIGADLNGGADAPNIRPPRASRGWAQHGPLCLRGHCPGLPGGHTQFAMGFVIVPVESQSLDVRVGSFDLGDLFAGEVGGKSALPELVLTFDFPFRLGRWSIKEADVVERLRFVFDEGRCSARNRSGEENRFVGSQPRGPPRTKPPRAGRYEAGRKQA